MGTRLQPEPVSPPEVKTPAPPRTRRWRWFLGVCLLLAAILRFSFPQDIEYKSDERYMVVALQQYRSRGVIPAVGMGSSAGVPNPGLSVWLFLFLGRLFDVDGPVGLARSVAALNLLALLILAFGVRAAAPPAERPVWNWTAALLSVNVFGVLFARKIWAQCLAPFFAVLLILAWFRRDRRVGAFFTGLLMVLLGQVHMAGFFFAAALLLWSGVFERFRHRPKIPAWPHLTAGLAVGCLPLIPWLPYARLHSAAAGGRLLTDFWYQWFRTSLGLGLEYSLGRVQALDLLRWPILAGHPTYLVLALQVVTAGMIARLLSIVLRSRRVSLWPLLGAGSETAFLESAGLWGAGLLLTLPAAPIYTHYLLVMYPLPWLWIARLGTAAGRKGRAGLAVIWGAQLLISISFLLYIHAHHGAVYGDYGISYGYQQK